MIELERHIEILLLSNDCVIVPGLGGFMTHHIEARYEEKEAMFLPPQRTLGFNPQLKLNDSLLAQSYIEAYDISYPEALNRIEDEVHELRQHLENEGYYELNDIGRLSVNDEGHLEFEPCEAGILTPGLYGLSSFEMRLLGTAVSKKQAKVLAAVTDGEEAAHEKPQQDAPVETVGTDAEQQPETEEEEERAITIKMSWVRNAVAAAVAMLAFLVFTPEVDNDEPSVVNRSQLNLPIINSDTNKMPAATLDEQSVKAALQQREPEAKAAEAVEEPTENSEQAAPDSKQTAAETEQPVAEPQPESSYCIVLASQVSQANAEEFVGKLKKQGYSDARVYLNNKIRRVVCGSFKTENEAYQQLRQVHKDKQLEEAWVYHMR